MSRLSPSIQEHEKDYNTRAWEAWSFFDLICWVRLYTRRASHRSSLEKAAKDLQDAQNYLEFLKETISVTPISEVLHVITQLEQALGWYDMPADMLPAKMCYNDVIEALQKCIDTSHDTILSYFGIVNDE